MAANPVKPAEKYPVKSGGRECKRVGFVLTGVNGDDPTITADPCNVIDTATRDGEGSFVVKLLTKYTTIVAQKPNVESTTENDHAQIDTVTDGTSATNYVYLSCFLAGAADDLDGVAIHVSFDGYA